MLPQNMMHLNQLEKKLNKSLSLNDSLKIIAIGVDSPAARNGLSVGDEIIEINGKKAPIW